MNIDFTHHAGFSTYVLLLMFSGLAMIVIGSPVVKRQRPLMRVLNLLFGIGFFCYGFYLAFLFDGGTYVIFFKAFILPVLLIVRSLAGRPAPKPAAASYAGSAPYGLTPPSPAWGAGTAGSPPPSPAAGFPPAAPAAGYAAPAAGYAAPTAGYAAPTAGYAAPTAGSAAPSPAPQPGSAPTAPRPTPGGGRHSAPNDAH